MGPMPQHHPFTTPSTRGAPAQPSGYTKSGYDKSTSGYSSGYAMASQPTGYAMPSPRALMNAPAETPHSNAFAGYAGTSLSTAHPGSCRASGDGLYTAMARRAAHFIISAVDAAGNRRHEGGEPFVVSIRGPGAVTTSVRDCQDGTYSVGWVVRRLAHEAAAHARARGTRSILVPMRPAAGRIRAPAVSLLP